MHNLEKEVAENFYTILRVVHINGQVIHFFAIFHAFHVLKPHFCFFMILNVICGNVDNLSTTTVDNSEKHCSALWIMWITYPHRLWITLSGEIRRLWKCG